MVHKLKMILSIDPGLNSCGAALWEHSEKNELVWAGLVKNSGTGWRSMVDAVDAKLLDFHLLHPPDRLVIEIPQVYTRTRSKGDPNDLIQLAAVVGAFSYWHRGFLFIYKPAEWKGQSPKQVIEARARKRLSAEELTRIEKSAKSLMHNTLDAVSLGLFHLRRLPLTDPQPT